MVLCIIAFFVFAVMSIFSAKYRPLAKEGFRCVFRTIMLKPCDTGMDERIKAEVVSKVLKISPALARFTNKHFTMIAWAFVILSLGSMVYSGFGLYNFYFYGNCDGPEAVGACIINDLTGDYGRFSEPTDLIAPTNFDGIVAGNPEANITIVEFGCFTCPYTKKAESTMSELLEKYSDSLYYVFKPFPLPNHQNSYEAAIGVLCAERQGEHGKHFELQEEIFKQQEVCTSDGTLAIKKLAQDAGLDMNAFNQCYDNNETADQLEEYIQQGKDSHIYATPTFFINGKTLVGPRPIEEFEKIISEES